MATIAQRKKARNVQTTKNRGYARLNKNIINKGELGRLIREGFTGRDFYVLVVLLAEAQRRGKRILIFKSDYAILKLLGWQYCSKDYVDLDCALKNWSKAKLEFETFHKTKKKPRRRRENALRRQELVSPWKPCAIEGFLSSYYLDDGRVQIVFDRDFWKLNGKEGGYFVEAWPHLIKELKHPHHIALHLFIKGFTSKLDGRFGKELTRDMDKLAWILGMNMDRPRRFARRIEKALDRVNVVTRNFYKCRVRRVQNDEFGWYLVFYSDPNVIPLPFTQGGNLGL